MNGYVYVWCRIAANPIDVVVVGQRENVFIYASNTCIIMCTSINNAEHFFFWLVRFGAISTVEFLISIIHLADNWSFVRFRSTQHKHIHQQQKMRVS